MLRSCLTLTLVLAAGCGSGKAPVADDFADLNGADVKSDAFSKKMRLVGDVQPNDPAVTTSYSSKPSYRAYRLRVSEGGVPITIRVTSTQGDAVTWLTDSTFHVLAKNDDADASTYDSLIEKVLDAADYYVIFRDYNWESHRFSVTVQAPVKKPTKPAGPPPPVVPTDCAAFASFPACAEGIFDALAQNDRSCDNPLSPAQLPSGVRAWNDAVAPKIAGNNVGKFSFDAGARKVYVIWFDLEESYWVYLVDSSGKLIAYSSSGDGCGTNNGWSAALSPNDDPFSCKCSTGSAPDHCNFC